MPRDYLQKIAQAAFPLRVDDPYEVQCVHVLRAAEMVEAAITPATPGTSEMAVILRITPMGRAEIERIKRDP